MCEMKKSVTITFAIIALIGLLVLFIFGILAIHNDIKERQHKEIELICN